MYKLANEILGGTINTNATLSEMSSSAEEEEEEISDEL